ncbi:MAG: hypothetical protein M3O22_07595, partial [Pseudomonadota bacterium]|nr:hypothetical protein [Pseudomonadota bacterium]
AAPGPAVAGFLPGAHGGGSSGRYSQYARLDPDWAQVERQTLDIAIKSTSSLIQNQGIGDLYRLYLETQRDGVEFNVAFIPSTFITRLEEPFDHKYMQELYDVGYARGAKGNPWQKAPPGYLVLTSARAKK